MDRKPTPGAGGPAPSIGLQRALQLFDSYGASPDRWPPEQKEAVLRLLKQSAEARAERDRAARLDTVLDLAPAHEPSPALVARVLAGAPAQRGKPPRRAALSRPQAVQHGKSRHRRSGRLWRYLAAAAPLAAAATVVFWLTRGQEPLPREPIDLVIAGLGAYQTPTDVLLDPPAFDLFRTVPALGCPDSLLGCPELDSSGDLESKSHLIRRTHV